MSTGTKAEPPSMTRRRRSESVASCVLTGQPGRQRAAAMCLAALPTDRIEFTQLQGVVDGNALLERDDREFKREFELDVQAAAQRALRRDAEPAALDEVWKPGFKLSFNDVGCGTRR